MTRRGSGSYFIGAAWSRARRRRRICAMSRRFGGPCRSLRSRGAHSCGMDRFSSRRARIRHCHRRRRTPLSHGRRTPAETPSDYTDLAGLRARLWTPNLLGRARGGFGDMDAPIRGRLHARRLSARRGADAWPARSPRRPAWPTRELGGRSYRAWPRFHSKHWLGRVWSAVSRRLWRLRRPFTCWSGLRRALRF